jgi:hypothetical protein
MSQAKNTITARMVAQ